MRSPALVAFATLSDRCDAAGTAVSGFGTASTGVTTGSLLSGVKFRKDVIETETVVMRSVTGTVRYIKAEHRQLEKFHLD